jgi:TonB family protein
MILTISYAIVIAVLLGLGALYAERILADLGRPRRLAWAIALLGSIVLPAYTLLVETKTPDSAIISLPLPFDLLPDLDAVAITPTTVTGPAGPWLTWPDWAIFDSAITVLWVASSVAMLLFYIVASLMLRRLARRSEAATVGDQPILVSDDVGPAVFGIIAPRIVLPRWLAEQESSLRSLVLHHEREHLAARDHLVLIAALVVVASMPWNLALWWQMRRLRAAIELDCDARVLRGGIDPRDYSEALFIVGQRPTGIPLGAVALTEPVSELERRIRIMLEKTRRFSIALFGSRLTLVSAAAVLALAVNAPNAQQNRDGEATTARKTVPTVRTQVFDQLNAAQECMSDEDLDCTRRHLASVAEMQDLNAYETAQLFNFRAFAAFAEDDSEGAIDSYESLLGLPRDEIPDGLVQGTMRNLATLYVQQGRYEDGLGTYDEWLDLPSVEPEPEDLYVKSTILYQLERYEDALAPLEAAIAGASEPAESQYQLLYVLQYQTEDVQGAIETLELMNSRWPSERWAEALAGTRLQQQGAVEELGTSAISDGIGQFRQDTPNRGPEEYLPIVRVAPIYPPRAAARGLEGYVVLSYTVNARGVTENIEVVESSAPGFEQASIESVEKYRYRPRIVDGQTVAVEGVVTRVLFDLDP